MLPRCAGRPAATPASSAKSMPAVTPPPVTRVAVDAEPASWSASRRKREEIHRVQCVAARLAFSKTAAPSTSEPVHTEVMYFAATPAGAGGQHLLVFDHVVGAEPAGHADHVELRAIARSRRVSSARVAGDRLDPFPDQVHLAPGTLENTAGSGEIELGHPWKQDDADLKRGRHDESLSKFAEFSSNSLVMPGLDPASIALRDVHAKRMDCRSSRQWTKRDVRRRSALD